jgi:hypothetical protein
MTQSAITALLDSFLLVLVLVLLLVLLVLLLVFCFKDIALKLLFAGIFSVRNLLRITSRTQNKFLVNK